MADDLPTPSRRSPAISRRRLIGGSGVAAVALAAGSGARAAMEQDAVPDDPRRVTYEESDHIRFFYQRARM